MNAKLDGVAIGGWERDPNARYGSFVCDNGYRISIKYRSPQRISLAFNNNRKEAFIDYLDGGNHRYANAKNTLRWQENGTSGVLTYPDTDYAVSKRLLETPCRAR
nr:hypothetical protein LVJ77_09915 [Conchiformibius kuhniae]